MVSVPGPASDLHVVTISYDELLDDAKNISDTIEQAYGQGALGLLTVSGVPRLGELRANLLPLAHKFAELPGSVKTMYEDPESSWSFGWSHGREILQDNRPDTYKGSFYANPCTDAPTDDSVLMKKHPSYCRPNIWPTEHMPQLEPAFKELGQLIVDVGLLIASRCDRYIQGLRPGAKQNQIQECLRRSCCHKARLLHYFPPSGVEDCSDSYPSPRSWCGLHRDHCSLTGLTAAMFTSAGGKPAANPDIQAGLYVQTRQGCMQQVRIPPDQIAYQMGEAIQVVTGGVLCATPHHVQGPRPQLAGGIARNTFAVFMQPHWDEVLELPDWADEASVIRAGGLKGWVPGCTFGSFTTRTLANYH